MYESVVRIIHDDLRIKQEESVMTVIQNLGIDVNKEELIKALQYDRDQYDKGYADGYEDAHEDIEKLTELMSECDRLKKENQLLWKKHTPVAVEVRELDEEFDIKTKHCPNCGVRLVKWGQCGLNYCSECGQALKFEAGSAETDRPGGWSLPDDDTEIGMIANINDRM